MPKVTHQEVTKARARTQTQLTRREARFEARRSIIILGHMGREVARLSTEGCRGARLVGGVDPNGTSEEFPVWASFAELPASLGISCVVDFSHHSCAPALLEYAKAARLPVVVATTGHTEEELAAIREAAQEIPIFFSANMSYGVALLVELAKEQKLPLAEFLIGLKKDGKISETVFEKIARGNIKRLLNI